jgi:4'-phosphopantetheinyl transferase EntD
MIDNFALVLGHGLMAIALLRLVLRADLDADPLLAKLKQSAAANRRAASMAGRNAARRARAAGHKPSAEG